MKQLQEIVNKAKAAQQELNMFLVAAQCNMLNHIANHCKIKKESQVCRDCKQSYKLYDAAQKLLDDK